MSHRLPLAPVGGARDGRPLRIALLTYRGNARSGGQGVYVRYLSRALSELGHSIEVFSGPPYPDLDPSVPLRRVPSLDLYRPDDPFHTPSLREFGDWIDVLEFALMCTAAFPEPLTFSLRAARALRAGRHDFDVVHDNQSLGYGLLELQRHTPVVATIHHPITIDRRVHLEHASTWTRALSLRRWYSFVRMQGRVARRLRSLLAVSEATRGDAVADLGVVPERVSVVHNGVDVDLFRPLPLVAKEPGRMVAVISSGGPLKGLPFLLEALAKVRTERDAHLVVIGEGGNGGSIDKLIAGMGLEDAVRREGGVDGLRLVELLCSAQASIVPSLHEGFSLPAVEAMSCGLPLIATTAGALPEVVGRDVGLLVPPADAGALAHAMGTLLDDEALRTRLGHEARGRVLARFTWESCARNTEAVYREAIASC
jgi:glycosyltransferase involved in cell wall biosynthesis